jgi:VanZ family protein
MRSDKDAPLAGYFCCAYLVLILVASLYPFSGWRDNGMPSAFFLDAAFPRYWTAFDLAVNVFAYFPFGFLLFLATAGRLGRGPAILLALCAGTSLSLAVEMVQNWLPSRVPSNVDVLCNTLGALLGALVAEWRGERWADFLAAQTRALWRSAPYAELGLVLVAFWLIAQLTPGQMLFGSGDFRFWWLDWLDVGAVPYSPPTVLRLEAIAVACQMLAIGLLVRQLLAGGGWTALPMLLLFFLATFALKALSISFMLSPASAFDWLTVGAQHGLLLGGGALLLAIFLPGWARTALASLALLLGTLAVNLTPETPYAAAEALKDRTGQFFNFAGLARWLGVAWPFLVVPYLSLVLSTQRPPGNGGRR